MVVVGTPGSVIEALGAVEVNGKQVQLLQVTEVTEELCTLAEQTATSAETGRGEDDRTGLPVELAQRVVTELEEKLAVMEGECDAARGEAREAVARCRELEEAVARQAGGCEAGGADDAVGMVSGNMGREPEVRDGEMQQLESAVSSAFGSSGELKADATADWVARLAAVEAERDAARAELLSATASGEKSAPTGGLVAGGFAVQLRVKAQREGGEGEVRMRDVSGGDLQWVCVAHGLRCVQMSSKGVVGLPLCDVMVWGWQVDIEELASAIGGHLGGEAASDGV